MSAVSSKAASGIDSTPRASSNVRHLCRTELEGGGQIVIDGNYAYVGHQHRPHGTTILDIADPRKPKILSSLNPGHPWSHSHKARVVGDLMVVNSEFEGGGGARREEYPDGGFRMYDIKDRTNPKLVTFVKTHGKGVHRFDLDESYAYISTEMEGYVGNILVIYDIRNPSKPVAIRHARSRPTPFSRCRTRSAAERSPFPPRRNARGGASTPASRTPRCAPGT
jgi:hypothetical protein